MTGLFDIDSADEIAARALPDPRKLKAAELRALRMAHRFRLVECRGGFRAGDAKVSKASTDRLEHLGLARKALVRHRYELLATDAGKELLNLIDSPKTGKGPR